MFFDLIRTVFFEKRVTCVFIGIQFLSAAYSTLPFERDAVRFCTGNTTYLFTASQLYTALSFHGFRHASFYNSCKENTKEQRESHVTLQIPSRGTHGYHCKSSLFGILLSLPERVQRAVTFSPPCPLLERATSRLCLKTGTLLLLTQFVSSFPPPCAEASSGITCGVADAISSLCRRCTGLFRTLFSVRTVAVLTRPSRPG